MRRSLRAGASLAFVLGLTGCSTLTGDFHQNLQIETVDAQNHPVEGMRCQVGSGDSAKTFTTPAHDVRVRRSAFALTIECQRNGLLATATVKPRRERMEEALLPFGTVGVFVDHLSGSLYSYPTTLRLQVGQHLVLEHGGEAQVATSEPIAPPAPSPAVRTLEVVTPQPAVAAPTVNKAPAVWATQKAPPSSAPKIARAAPKSIKTASLAASKPKPRTAAPQKVRLAATATPVAAPVPPSAPVNW